MPFTIPDLTPDDRPWRIDWFGEVTYQRNGQRRSQPLYRVLISPVLNDLSLPEILTDEHDQREAWLSIGTLPMVCVGDIWQSGERVIQPSYTEASFAVQVSNSWGDIIKAGMSIDGQFLLPLNEHPFHRDATQSYGLCLTVSEGLRLIIPCMEIIRFYFGSSSNLLHTLFTQPLCEEALLQEKSFDPATGHLHLKLANKLSGASSSDIGRIALSKEAWRSAAGIHASCVAASTQKRAAYPYTGLPFIGHSTIKASGRWLSFSGVKDSTFLVYRLQSCTHHFPFETLSYELSDFKHLRGTKKSADENSLNGGASATKVDAQKPSTSAHDPDRSKRTNTRTTYGKGKFPDLNKKIGVAGKD